jgi:hypothetical protein
VLNGNTHTSVVTLLDDLARPVLVLVRRLLATRRECAGQRAEDVEVQTGLVLPWVSARIDFEERRKSRAEGTGEGKGREGK